MTTDLAHAVESLPPNRFAVLDGAHIDGLPERLRTLRMAGVPLYLEAGNEDGIRSGPYLVAIETHDEIRDAIALAGGKPAIVFWSWPGDLWSSPSDFPALRRHLRGLNLAEIPNERRTSPDDPAYETVLFRHWDANVLAVTLPVLKDEQQARFLGEAHGLAYDAAEYGGIAVVTRPASLPSKPKGMLRLEPTQIETMTGWRVSASHERIAAYLREVAPIPRMSDTQLLSIIERHEVEARSFGLVSEVDVGRWAYLQLVSGGVLAGQPLIQALFANPSANPSPSERLDALFDASIAHARSLG